MGLSRLSSKCRKCPFVDICTKKKMQAEAYLESAAMPAGADVMQPLLVPHDYRDVKIDENTTITIDLEELKRQLEQEFYQKAGLGLQFGT